MLWSQSIMKQLYNFNHQPELWGTISEDSKFVSLPSLPRDHPNAWNGKGGPLACWALQAIYPLHLSVFSIQMKCLKSIKHTLHI
jgi:hypothetical protein